MSRHFSGFCDFPEAEVHAVDLSPDALDVAERNIRDHHLEDRITLYEGDLFSPLGSCQYDLILTNPPYVDAPSMRGLPPRNFAMNRTWLLPQGKTVWI